MEIVDYSLKSLAVFGVKKEQMTGIGKYNHWLKVDGRYRGGYVVSKKNYDLLAKRLNLKSSKEKELESLKLEYKREKLELNYFTFVQSQFIIHFKDVKICPKSWLRWSDKNLITRSFALSYLRKWGKNLDTICEELSYILFNEPDMVDVQEIVDLLIALPNGLKTAYYPCGNGILRELKEKINMIRFKS